MIRKVLALVALLAFASCSMPDEIMANDCPREGGIGGTGDCPVEPEV